MVKKIKRVNHLKNDLISRGYTDINKLDLMSQDDIFFMLKDNYQKRNQVQVLIDKNGDYQFVFSDPQSKKKIRIPRLKITFSMEKRLTNLFNNESTK